MLVNGLYSLYSLNIMTHYYCQTAYCLHKWHHIQLSIYCMKTVWLAKRTHGFLSLFQWDIGTRHAVSGHNVCFYWIIYGKVTRWLNRNLGRPYWPYPLLTTSTKPHPICSHTHEIILPPLTCHQILGNKQGIWHSRYKDKIKICTKTGT